jgi:hypothetical protein
VSENLSYEVVEMYLYKGVEFIKDIMGEFVIAIYDKRDESMELDSLIGKTLKKDIGVNHFFTKEDFE